LCHPCQVIECRRILKWTYAYGYYSWPDEEDDAMSQRRHFFEFLQGDAERILDQVSTRDCFIFGKLLARITSIHRLFT
jgi:hypothetical protein